MNIRIARSAAILALLSAAAAQPAIAATTDTLDVSATVTSNCNVSAGTVAFGDVDVTTGAAVDGTGTISVTCTSGTAWSAAADAGAGTGASLATRKMANGANLLNYALYTDSARTNIWGDAADASTVKVTGTGTGSAQSTTIYGSVLASQTSLPAGAYTDTVTVTVSY
ncbi:Csu type fimbrial protein [Allosphingosinicella sp.]|uniref:Csu type fimbrial protein n=1 Tax=Allosphingosinicella sp. TaxID=2823234 RepID=UPI002FC17702